MITEHALLPVIPGREDDFERAFAEARAIIMSMPGCRSLSLSRSIESPSSYLLLVEWEHLDDHTIGFRQSEEYQRWRTLLHQFYDPFPLVEHYQAVQLGGRSTRQILGQSSSAPTPPTLCHLGTANGTDPGPLHPSADSAGAVSDGTRLR